MSEMNLLRKGQEEAFEEVFHKFHSRLYFFFLKHTEDPYQSEELTQISFIKLWQYRARLSYECTLSEQVFRIAKTCLIDAFRKKAREEKRRKQMEENEQQHVQQASAHELLDQLQNGIRAMPPVQQKVFLLSRYDGLSNKEIANHLSISPKTVERHITKALYSLRRLFYLLF